MAFVAASAEDLADWIETCILVSSSHRFGLDRLLKIALEELSVEEARVSGAIRVMSKRAEVMGDLYPFHVSDIAVRSRDAPFQAEYATLLCLSPGSPARQTVRDATNVSEMGELLERIAAPALQNFWGRGGEAIRFGHPSEIGRPKEFDSAILWLAKLMGLKPGRGYRPPLRKDGGVDIVAWRRFLDGRAGFPIALAQCTVQAEAFTKTTDVDLRLWASWLAMDVDPLSLLVIPGTIRRQGPEWGQLATVVMVIDRIRLVELLGRGEALSLDLGWTSDTLQALTPLMLAGES